jgi:hypothetical protein
MGRVLNRLGRFNELGKLKAYVSNISTVRNICDIVLGKKRILMK